MHLHSSLAFLSPQGAALRSPWIQDSRTSERPSSLDRRPAQIANRKSGHTYWIHEWPSSHMQQRHTISSENMASNARQMDRRIRYIYIYIDLPLTIDSNKQLASNRRLRPSCPFQSARTRLSLSYSSSYHNINVFDRSPNLRINTHRGYYWHRGSPQSTLPPPAYQSIVCRHCCHLTLIKSPTPTCAVYELPSCLTAFHRSSFPRAPTPVYRTGNLRRSQRAAGKVKRTEWDHVHR